LERLRLPLPPFVKSMAPETAEDMVRLLLALTSKEGVPEKVTFERVPLPPNVEEFTKIAEEEVDSTSRLPSVTERLPENPLVFPINKAPAPVFERSYPPTGD
jgi:hypothetical protein